MPQKNSNMNNIKEDVINSAMPLLKGRKMVFKAFEIGIMSKLRKFEITTRATRTFKT